MQNSIKKNEIRWESPNIKESVTEFILNGIQNLKGNKQKYNDIPYNTNQKIEAALNHMLNTSSDATEISTQNILSQNKTSEISETGKNINILGIFGCNLLL